MPAGPKACPPAVVAAAAALSCAACVRSSAPPIAFVHAQIADARGLQRDRTVVVSGNRIASVGDGAPPAGARVIDATGLTLAPGLWDMHTHVLNEGRIDRGFSLLLGYGVTGIRDVGGASPAALAQARELLGTRAFPGPRFNSTARFIDGAGSNIGAPRLLRADTDEQARASVATVQRDGGEFVKLYLKVRRAQVIAAVDEAHKRGLRVIGHAPLDLPAMEASDLGYKSFEHLWGLLLGCSSREASLQPLVAVEGLRTSQFPATLKYARDILSSQDDARCDALLQRLAKNGTAQCATLVSNQFLMLGPTAFPPDVVPAWVGDTVKAGVKRRKLDAVDPELWAATKALLPRLQRQGVMILAGTDAPIIAIPGWSLHEELALMVEAGLTPQQALATATIEPARWLGREHELGTIEAGKLADLIVLEGNPLERIGATRDLRAVIADGVYLERSRLDQLRRDGSRPL